MAFVREGAEPYAIKKQKEKQVKRSRQLANHGDWQHIHTHTENENWNIYLKNSSVPPEVYIILCDTLVPPFSLWFKFQKGRVCDNTQFSQVFSSTMLAPCQLLFCFFNFMFGSLLNLNCFSTLAGVECLGPMFCDMWAWYEGQKQNLFHTGQLSRL